jgi:branched-chain amino acid transport system ATP-binding protein
MLEVENLVVRYGQTTALYGVSFTVPEAGVVSIVGPNGAGKSTTLNAVVGVVPATAGSVRFRGEDILGEKPENALRKGISLVPEGRNIFASLTVTENLTIGATTRNDRRAVAREVKGYLDRFPALGRRKSSAAGKLSGGEQQQLAIARALIANPRLLLLDEPSLGLAPLIVDQIFQVIRELRETGTTVLLVEQNAARAIELADRTYVLRAGHVVLEGTAEAVLGTEDFVSSYLGVAPGRRTT